MKNSALGLNCFLPGRFALVAPARFGLLALVVSVLAWAAPVSAAEGAWMTDFAAAKEKASNEDKPLLLNFTGSDWCPPCKLLHKNVFEKDAFQTYADEALVLVELDFPRQKPQSDALQEQNKKLAESFGIRGFPTIIILDPEGEVLDKTVGLEHPDVDGFITHTKSVVSKR